MERRWDRGKVLQDRVGPLDAGLRRDRGALGTQLPGDDHCSIEGRAWVEVCGRARGGLGG